MSWEESVNRGALALAQADYVKAARAFEVALEAADSEFAADDWRLGQTLSFLGLTYFKAGIYGSAVEYLNRSTSLNDSSDAVRLAADHLSLAYINQSNGQKSKASEHVSQAVSGIKNYRLDSLEVTALTNLLRHVEQKQIEQSQSGFRQLLADAQRNYESHADDQIYFGTEPDEAVLTWQDLMKKGSQSFISGGQEALVEAYKNLNSALRIASTTFASGHVNIAESLTALAIVSAQLGLSDDAEELFGKAAEVYEQQGDAETKLALLNLHMARFYSDLGDHSLAIQCLSEAAELLQTTEKLPDITNSIFLLLQKANIYQRCRELLKRAIELEDEGNYEPAIGIYDDCLTLMENLLGRQNLEYTQIMRFKATALTSTGAVTEAKSLSSRAEEIENVLVEKAIELDRLKANLPTLKKIIS